VNAACASTVPATVYSKPRCVPLSLPEAFQNRRPVILPAVSERNFTPRVTGLSARHGSLIEAEVFQIDLSPETGVSESG
jgi:hypothetical protein